MTQMIRLEWRQWLSSSSSRSRQTMQCDPEIDRQQREEETFKVSESCFFMEREHGMQGHGKNKNVNEGQIQERAWDIEKQKGFWVGMAIQEGIQDDALRLNIPLKKHKHRLNEQCQLCSYSFSNAHTERIRLQLLFDWEQTTKGKSGVEEEKYKIRLHSTFLSCYSCFSSALKPFTARKECFAKIFSSNPPISCSRIEKNRKDV